MVTILVLALSVTGALRLQALETDQYASWGHPVADSTGALNAWFNLQLRETLAAASRHGEIPSRRRIEKMFERRLRFLFIIHPPELWAGSSSLVGRYPDSARDEIDFRRSNLYHNHGILDVGLWMPISPTIQVNGVRFGTDKLSHFVSLGWQLYTEYRRLRAHGMSAEDAERKALRSGFDGERYFLLGYRTSGILSLSDMESDHQGMIFFRDLCGGNDPVLERTGAGWKIRRPIDLRSYVTPEWDESYEPQIFRKGRWKKIRPVLQTYCRWLDDPWLIEQRQRYRQRDRLTLSESLVLQEVARKKLPDPRRFTLESVCGRRPRPLDGGGRTAGHPLAAGSARPEIEREIIDDSRKRRSRLVGLWEAGYSRPLGFSGALGAMAARLPSGTPCRLLCSFTGPFVQLGAGSGGARMSLGFGRLWADLTDRGTFASSAYMGIGVRATLLRTWSDPVGTAVGGTFLGPEMEFSVAKINISLGALRRLDGAHSGDWTFSWSLGFGF